MVQGEPVEKQTASTTEAKQATSQAESAGETLSQLLTLYYPKSVTPIDVVPKAV